MKMIIMQPENLKVGQIIAFNVKFSEGEDSYLVVATTGRITEMKQHTVLVLWLDMPYEVPYSHILGALCYDEQ